MHAMSFVCLTVISIVSLLCAVSMVTCSNADAGGPCVIQCYIAAHEYIIRGSYRISIPHE